MKNAQKRKQWLFLLTVLSCITLSSVVYAHPGRTDSIGGHHDYENESGLGSYHYHHGYEAHLHENGICPYDYVDNTSDSNANFESKYTEEYIQNIIDDVTEHEDAEKSYWAPDSTKNVYLSDGVFHLKGCPKISSSGVFYTLRSIDKSNEPCDYCQPLIYESIEDIPTHKKDLFLKFISDNWHYGVACVLAVLALIQFIKFFKEQKEDEPVHEIPMDINSRKAAKKTQEETLQEYYYSLYAYKKPEDLVDIPDGMLLVDGLPATNHHHKYGLYSVYITPKGTRYHRRKKCAGSEKSQITNLYLVYKQMYPCKMCCQRYNPNIDFEWYEEYLRIKEIKKKYNIP